MFAWEDTGGSLDNALLGNAASSEDGKEWFGVTTVSSSKGGESMLGVNTVTGAGNGG